MSKPNNANQGAYKDGDRNHQGEGIVHEEEKQDFRNVEKRQGQQGEGNFIPGEAPVGEKSDK